MKKGSRIYNINLKTIAFLCVGASIFSSCNKNEKLNPKSTTLITDEDGFLTADRIEAQVNGLYTNLKAGNFLGMYYSIISEIRAGDFIANTSNAANGYSTYQMNVQNSTNEVGDIWVAGYQVINKTNIFLDGMNAGGSSVLTETKSKNYMAEARLIRAVAYYYLLQLYAQPYSKDGGTSPGLPLRLTGIKVLGNNDLARSSVAQTYQQILDDLDYAENNLPLSNSAANNTSRAHRNTAIALKTRVYLHMGKYPEVITEANKIVSAASPFSAPTGVAHTLQANIVDVFKPGANSVESIFSMPFTNNDRPGASFGNYFLPGNDNGGNASMRGAELYLLDPAGLIADQTWTDTDDRRNFIFTGTSGTIRKKYLKKFSQASPFLDWAPVIRYSEVLLNLAEAIARTTNGIDTRALSLLHDVRYRSDKNTVFTSSSFSNNSAFIDAILKEKHIELLGEGLRNSEIMRLGIDIPSKNGNAVAAVSPTSRAYIFPIPISELLLNKAMVDN